MIRFRLLCSSLAPLLLIVGVRIWAAHTVVAGVILLAAIASVGSLLLLMNTRGTLSSQSFALETVEDESDQIPAYLVTYLLPFVTLNIAGISDLIGYLMLAGVLLLLVLRTDLIYVQPVLLVAGWHLYRTTVTGGYEEFVMISRKRLRIAHEVHTVGVREQLVRVVDVDE